MEILHYNPPPPARTLRCFRHLRPSALSTLTRPSVLITDAHNVLTEVKNRKWRETRLLSTVMDTVRSGGNVLLPTDTAGTLKSCPCTIV